MSIFNAVPCPLFVYIDIVYYILKYQDKLNRPILARGVANKYTVVDTTKTKRVIWFMIQMFFLVALSVNDKLLYVSRNEYKLNNKIVELRFTVFHLVDTTDRQTRLDYNNKE